MPILSAGIVLYRRSAAGLEVLLVHPGGPYWASRDQGAWMIPKGVVEPGEAAAACAIREFEEELGTRPSGTPQPLGRIRQKGGKWVEGFAIEGDLDPDRIFSNGFEMEWPPRSGQLKTFPEVDRAAWFTVAQARAKILPSQVPLLDAMARVVGGRPPPHQ